MILANVLMLPEYKFTVLNNEQEIISADHFFGEEVTVVHQKDFAKCEEILTNIANLICCWVNFILTI
jgi:hypothetical protein